jgi:putative Mg2+ transporter-C (MgtC) family protein
MDITFLDRDIGNLLVAAILGGILGVEREWRGKSAGFRTLMLVSVGAALFTEVSIIIAGLNENHDDATRIASNIVTGIGFIGAGLIFKSDKSVRGLTTATTVWVAAAIGMAAGAHDFRLAVATTIIAWLILVVLHLIEKAFERVSQTRQYRLCVQPGIVMPQPAEMFEGKFKIVEQKLEKENNLVVITWQIRSSSKIHDMAARKMVTDARIISLTQ